MKLVSIEIDQEVFEHLQRRATPFVDKPNDVLRRLLLETESQSPSEPELELPPARGSYARSTAAERARARRGLPMPADAFVNRVMERRFGGHFGRRAPYRMMFESSDTVLYFQNFNKETDHLWYRVTENPWRDLTASTKKAWLCLSNPAEGYCYVIPVSEIQAHVARAEWSRPYLEINIDPATSRWSELDWRLDEYLIRA